MRILSTYVFRQVAGAVVLILISLTGVIWITVALRQLELMTSQGQNALVFLKLTGLALPTLLAIIAPVALLLATLQTLNRLSGDSELIVMTAGGARTWRLLRPLMLAALIVTAAVAFVNHVASPWSQRKIREIAMEVRTDLISQVIQPGRFTSPEANLTIHIADRAPNGELVGLIMHDARDPKQLNSYLAERGVIIKQGKAAYLLMEKGHIVQRGEADAAARIIAFDKYAFDINPFEQKADAGGSLRPRERYTHELLNPDPNDSYYLAAPGRFRSELHDRTANALYPIAFILLALAFAGQAHTTRQSSMQGVIWGFGLAIAVRAGGIWASNFASVRPAGVILLYAFPLATIALAAIAVEINMRPRRPARLRLATAGPGRRQRQVKSRPAARASQPVAAP